MSDLHPFLDATKRIRVVCDPEGEARYARERESRWLGLFLLTVAFVLIGIVQLSLLFDWNGIH